MFEKESVYSIPSRAGAHPVVFQVLDFVGKKKRLHTGAHSFQVARSEGFVAIFENSSCSMIVCVHESVAALQVFPCLIVASCTLDS